MCIRDRQPWGEGEEEEEAAPTRHPLRRRLGHRRLRHPPLLGRAYRGCYRRAGQPRLRAARAAAQGARRTTRPPPPSPPPQPFSAPPSSLPSGRWMTRSRRLLSTGRSRRLMWSSTRMEAVAHAHRAARRVNQLGRTRRHSKARVYRYFGAFRFLPVSYTHLTLPTNLRV